MSGEWSSEVAAPVGRVRARGDEPLARPRAHDKKVALKAPPRPKTLREGLGGSHRSVPTCAEGAVLVASADGTKHKGRRCSPRRATVLRDSPATPPATGRPTWSFELDGQVASWPPSRPLAIEAEARRSAGTRPASRSTASCWAGRFRRAGRRRQPTPRRRRRSWPGDLHSQRIDLARLRLGPAARRRPGPARHDSQAGPVAHHPGTGVDGQGRTGRWQGRLQARDPTGARRPGTNGQGGPGPDDDGGAVNGGPRRSPTDGRGTADRCACGLECQLQGALQSSAVRGEHHHRSLNRRPRGPARRDSRRGRSDRRGGRSGRRSHQAGQDRAQRQGAPASDRAFCQSGVARADPRGVGGAGRRRSAGVGALPARSPIPKRNGSRKGRPTSVSKGRKSPSRACAFRRRISGWRSTAPRTTNASTRTSR